MIPTSMVNQQAGLQAGQHPYRQARMQVEDQVRSIVDPMPEHALAVMSDYLRALGWTHDRATAVKRKAFGD